MPPEKRNFFFRGFNKVYGTLERGYASLIGRMAVAAGSSVRVAYHHRRRRLGLARMPTGFLPIEDQGYVLVSVQLPDGASLSAPSACSTRSARSPARPRVDKVIAISGVSALDNNSTLANAGVAYVVLKDWSVRGKEPRTCCRCSSNSTGSSAA